MLLDSTLISQIPIKIITKESTIFPDFFLAKGGIKFRNSLGNSQLVSGFGFNSRRETSAQSARFEALEHLYATYDFQKETVQRKGGFYGAEFSNPDNVQRFSPSSVLIGPLPEDIGKSSDANGLGCHIFYDKAVEHALFEIMERHCLAQIWYGSTKIVEIEDANFLLGNLRVRNFTLTPLSIPFAVVVIDDKQEGIWALGSAFRDSMSDAIKHAQHEAMMLIESSMIDNGFSYSEEIVQRILSLRNREISRLREEFLQSKISGCAKLSGFILINRCADMAQRIFGWRDNIWVIDLIKCAELNVVRVLCPQAQNPRWHRQENAEVPYDPFC